MSAQNNQLKKTL